MCQYLWLSLIVTINIRLYNSGFPLCRTRIYYIKFSPSELVQQTKVGKCWVRIFVRISAILNKVSVNILSIQWEYIEQATATSIWISSISPFILRFCFVYSRSWHKLNLPNITSKFNLKPVADYHSKHIKIFHTYMMCGLEYILRTLLCPLVVDLKIYNAISTKKKLPLVEGRLTKETNDTKSAGLRLRTRCKQYG